MRLAERACAAGQACQRPSGPCACLHPPPLAVCHSLPLPRPHPAPPRSLTNHPRTIPAGLTEAEQDEAVKAKAALQEQQGGSDDDADDYRQASKASNSSWADLLWANLLLAGWLAGWLAGGVPGCGLAASVWWRMWVGAPMARAGCPDASEQRGSGLGHSGRLQSACLFLRLPTMTPPLFLP